MDNKSEQGKVLRPIDIKRAALIDLSVKARELKEEKILSSNNPAEAQYWEEIRINEIIAQWYKNQTGATTFNTFHQWVKLGYRINKGAKSVTLWAKKKTVKHTIEPINKPSDVIDSEYKFYPIAFLFSDLQVSKL